MIRAAVLAGVAVLAWQAPASAVSMSMNWIELGSITNLDACVAAGEATLRSNGLTVLDRTASAAWGEHPVQDELYAVYCVIDRGIAVITGAGADIDSVDTMVTRVVDGFGRSGPGPGSGGKPR